MFRNQRDGGCNLCSATKEMRNDSSIFTSSYKKIETKKRINSVSIHTRYACQESKEE